MLLGIDIGTTGTKTVLLSNSGEIIGYSYQGYLCSYPRPNCVEQSITDILNAVKKTVKDCTAKVPAGDRVEALCVSVQSGTLVPLKRNGEPYGNAISWLDMRCGQERDALLRQYDDTFFYHKTGWKLGASFNFIQIYKMRMDQPEETKDIFFANVSDCVTHMLVGTYYTDVNSAGNLQLLNVAKGDWDDDLLDIADIRRDQLGELVPCGAYLGDVLPEVARELGLGEHVKVYSGAQDQYCTAVGGGVTHPGDSLLSTGTSWVFMNINDKPMFDAVQYPAVAKHIAGETYASFVYTPAGGSAFKWLKNNVLAKDAEDSSVSYDGMTELASQVPPGAENLMFLPYLGGTLYPSWKNEMKGLFYGLDFSHDRRHMARAVMEGVGFELNLMIESLRSQGTTIDKMSGLGGATRSDAWMQIVSDITGVPISASTVADVAPIGAAMMAAVGCGFYQDYVDVSKNFKCMAERRNFAPNEKNHAFYQERFQEYLELNKLLQARY